VKFAEPISFAEGIRVQAFPPNVAAAAIAAILPLHPVFPQTDIGTMIISPTFATVSEQLADAPAPALLAAHWLGPASRATVGKTVTVQFFVPSSAPVRLRPAAIFPPRAGPQTPPPLLLGEL
jgi:hypothetical protein